MRVIELAKDLKVDTEALIHLLREMGIPVSGGGASVTDGQVAKVLARVERERRAGHRDPAEAVQAALEEAATAPRRRRRKKADEPEPAVAEVVEAEVPAAPAEPAVEEEAEAAPKPRKPRKKATQLEEPLVEAVEAATEPPAPEPIDAEAVEAEKDGEASPVAAGDLEVVAEAPGAEYVQTAPAAEDELPRAAPDAEAQGVPASDVLTPRPGQGGARPQPARGGAPVGSVRVIRRPAPAPAASAGPGGQVRIQAEGYTPDGRKTEGGAKGKKGKKRQRVDQDAVQENLARVMSEIKGAGGKGKKRRKGQSREEVEAQQEEARQVRELEARTVRVNEFLTVAELAELMDVSSTEIIGSAFKNLGLLVTINQRLDFPQIEMLLDEFGFTAVREEEYGAESEEDEIPDAPESLRPRPPVVTVMGHVDHGKTLLLDRIRKTNVVAGEAGGITQHIGAYHVVLPDGRSLSFLDTPGHAAFTAMRARGADVTDIVILIVAADDSVMPQTVEAISHARNAGVPMVVAINKVDLPAAQPGKVKQELLQHSVQVEDFGGDVLVAEISAKTGDGIDELLEKVLLQAEMLELKANPDREAQGAVIEAQLDIGKGPIVTTLVQRGTLRVGDSFLVGMQEGRVRALLDERGKAVQSVGPGVPVQILGCTGVPQAGDVLQVMEADRAAEIAQARQRLDREKQLRIRERGFKLGDFSKLVAEGRTATLPLVIKGDVDGSVQAVADALEQLGTKEVQVEIIHRAVGAINESDVLLAQTAGAVIIGFRVRPQTAARLEAERAGVDIQSYDIIYEAVDEIRAALEGMLSPEKRETVTGAADVREVFKITKVGTIAGCYVSEGRIDRKGRARVIRDGIVIYDGELSSLKRFKDDAKEVREGYECGIGIQNFNDLKVGDVIECYMVEEIARTLASSN
jgi:translation initiation factor IF-2